MATRFPTITSIAFREWLIVWQRFYRQVFGLRYNFLPLQGLPLPPQGFLWPVVVGGTSRSRISLLGVCLNATQAKMDSQLVIADEVVEAIKMRKLISMRELGAQPYVVWVRDPTKPNSYLQGVECRHLSRSHSTTTLAEEILLRLFVVFDGRPLGPLPAAMICGDSWIEGSGEEKKSSRRPLALVCNRFVAFVCNGTPELPQVVTVPPRADGYAREVFVP